MKIEDVRIGMNVKDHNGFVFQVVAIFLEGDVYLDFEGNEGDVWEEKAENLTEVQDGTKS